MTSLKQYIQSFREGLWSNVTLPAPWIHWIQLLRTLNRKEHIFQAENADEYIQHTKELLPHLSDSDLQFLYEQLTTVADHIQFAGPPLLVSNSHKILETGKVFRRLLDMKMHGDKYYLKHIGSKKAPKRPSLLFTEKAVYYSVQHWNDILQEAPMADTKKYIFFDPHKSNPALHPRDRVVFNIYAVFNKPYRELIHGSNISSDINDHIDLLIHDKILFDEIHGSTNNEYSTYMTGPVCIYDGSTIDRASCAICGKKFSTNQYEYHGPVIGDKLYTYVKDNEQSIRDIYHVPSRRPIIPNETLLKLARSLEPSM